MRNQVDLDDIIPPYKGSYISWVMFGHIPTPTGGHILRDDFFHPVETYLCLEWGHGVGSIYQESRHPVLRWSLRSIGDDVWGA